MDDLAQQLQSILQNPEMMAQVQKIASSMQAEAPKQDAAPTGAISPDMLKMAMELAGKSGMDKRQQALLGAMKPYMSPEKAAKLQGAMEAAHLAQLATLLLGGGTGGSHV